MTPRWDAITANVEYTGNHESADNENGSRDQTLSQVRIKLNL